MGLLGSLGKLAGKGLRAFQPQIAHAGQIAGKLFRRNAKAKIAAVLAGGTAGTIAGVKRFVKSKAGQLTMVGVGGAALGAGAERIVAGPRGGRRYRRINPGNSRAMRRAIRRIESGARLYSRFFAMKHGRIKHAPGVRIKHKRRAA